jgi:hypothetical protein
LHLPLFVLHSPPIKSVILSEAQSKDPQLHLPLLVFIRPA